MAINSLNDGYQSLIQEWIKEEEKGAEFPIDFDRAWRIAGYATKGSCKRSLDCLEKGIDFLTQVLKNSDRGRPAELIMFSCDAFKHLCLMAKTEKGKLIREYFISCEKELKQLKKENQNQPSSPNFSGDLVPTDLIGEAERYLYFENRLARRIESGDSTAKFLLLSLETCICTARILAERDPVYEKIRRYCNVCDRLDAKITSGDRVAGTLLRQLQEEINPPLPSEPSAPYVWPEGSEFAKSALEAICAKLISEDEAQ